MEEQLLPIIRQLTLQNQRLLACDYAEREMVLWRMAGKEPDPRSWSAVAVSRAFAMGVATRETLENARISAYSPSSHAAAYYTPNPAEYAAYVVGIAYCAAQAAAYVNNFKFNVDEVYWQIARAKEYLEAQGTAKPNLLSVLLQRKKILEVAVSSWQRDTEEMVFI